MNQEEKILEFDKIKQLWREFAFTESAKLRIAKTVPFLSKLELTKELRETSESRELLEKCGNPPLVSLNGVEEILKIASRGECLVPFQLEQISAALVATSRLITYLNRGKAYRNSLAYYVENLDDLAKLKEEINAAVCNEEVIDRASSRLQDIRRDIQRSEEKMREKADQVIRSNKECMSDSFSTFQPVIRCL